MNCSICGNTLAWCVDPDYKGTYYLCGECAVERVMESFLEKQILLRVARAAKKTKKTLSIDGKVIPDEWLELHEALKEAKHLL